MDQSGAPPRPTVRELQNWLADKPPSAEVIGYEGEDTGIVVRDAAGSWFFPTRDAYGRENPPRGRSE